jgi:predicted nucleotidyltransferase
MQTTETHGNEHPMERCKAIEIEAQKAELNELGVQHLFLSGSTARAAARADSDIIRFSTMSSAGCGLFPLMDIKARASHVLGREVAITARDWALRQQIEATAIPIF